MSDAKPERSIFERLSLKIAGNTKLRAPQQEGYEALRSHYSRPGSPREVGIVLPVGCGKSGLIAIAPFAMKARRVLVIAPNLNIADQLFESVDPSHEKFFLGMTDLVDGDESPEPAEIRGTSSNASDLEQADVVVTNIQQLQGSENRWLKSLPGDFFDAIFFDEAHHNVATSWEQLRKKFPLARIVNLSATPTRADGRVMEGTIIYSFPVAKAMELGFVKRLRATVLNPSTLRYVRRKDDEEIEVSLDEVRKLGEVDADFRRSIVTSKATLDTIVSCSIQELKRLRHESGNKRLKIIASALNYEHCAQVCEAFVARGLRADFVHSREESAKNAKVYTKLENDELDVIVQVRKLGEGFDHPLLAVAAVFSLFSSLGPFVQFVGRVMRVVEPNNPRSMVNRGVVVFHAGGNVHRRWDDFKNFSEADQAYFSDLFSTDYVEPLEGDGEQRAPRAPSELEIRAQGLVTTQVLGLLKKDARAREALEYLRSLGLTPAQIGEQAALVPVPATKQKKRKAARAKLDTLVKIKVSALLARRKLKVEGKGLDPSRPGDSNFRVVKARVDNAVAKLLSRTLNSRADWTQQELERAESALDKLVSKVEKELFDGAA